MIKVNATFVINEELLENQVDSQEVEDDEYEEQDIGEAIEAMARIVMERILNRAPDHMSHKELTDCLCHVWDYQEEDNYEMAYDLLLIVLLLVDPASREMVGSLVYPDKAMMKYFMDYFCEYLIDGLVINEMFGGKRDECESNCDM